MKEHMKYIADHAEDSDKLLKVKAQVIEVKEIMMNNIDQVSHLSRGKYGCFSPILCICSNLFSGLFIFCFDHMHLWFSLYVQPWWLISLSVISFIVLGMKLYRLKLSSKECNLRIKYIYFSALGVNKDCKIL